MEIWKPVVGFEGLYEVSDQGRVRSLDRQVGARGGKTRLIRGAVVKPQKHSSGYVQIGILRRTYLVHALVARAFIGPRPAGFQVAHNDGSRTNNAVSNLRYATPAENAKDRAIHGTATVGEANPRSRLTDSDIAEIRLRCSYGENQYRIARLFGVQQSQVSRIANAKRWAHV